MVIRKIQEQLAPGLPIDVSRPLDQQSYAEFSAAPIEVGRFVSDRIYVRYEQRYGGSRLGRSAANAEEASADYRLGKGFQLSTTLRRRRRRRRLSVLDREALASGRCRRVAEDLRAVARAVGVGCQPRARRAARGRRR